MDLKKVLNQIKRAFRSVQIPKPFLGCLTKHIDQSYGVEKHYHDSSIKALNE